MPPTCGRCAASSALIGPEHWGSLAHIPLLVGVGVVVAVLVHWLGAPDDVELLVGNIHVLGGPREVRGLRSLIPASLLCVAVGGPLGPEAPLVTATGTAGSLLGHRRQLSPNEVRMLAITGMAAGFTVLFGAPLGAALFALEILHRRGMEYYEALMPALVGSLCGYAVAVAARVVGLGPVWHFPTITTIRPGDLAWAVVAGVVGAIVAVAFTYLTIGLRRLVAVIPVGARPALGGLLIGLGALVTPYALTNGELQIDRLLDQHVVVGTLVGRGGGQAALGIGRRGHRLPRRVHHPAVLHRLLPRPADRRPPAGRATAWCSPPR